MCEVRSEILKLYKEYLSYLEGQLGSTISDPEYVYLQETIDSCINTLLPKEEHHKFGPFAWTTLRFPTNDEAKYAMDRICECEIRQHDLLDWYCPDPTFESFIKWLSEPKLNEELVQKLRSKRDR